MSEDEKVGEVLFICAAAEGKNRNYEWPTETVIAYHYYPLDTCDLVASSLLATTSGRR